ncbi:MAG: FHA domain-containing protein [Armatimonadia bacterium]
MDDNQTRPPDDEIEISLEDLEEDKAEALPPAAPVPAFTPSSGALVIDTEDLLDLSDEPAPTAAYPAPTQYPAAAAPGAFAPPMGKKGLVPTLVGSLLLHMFIAGAIGGLLAWAINEPMMGDGGSSAGAFFHTMIFTAIAGSIIGLCLGAVPGASELNPRKALIGGGISFGIGLFGGALAGVLAQGAYTLLGGRGDELSIMQIFARTVGWSIAGMFIGLSQGAAGRSWKKVLNGMVGGAVGGFVGGVLFDLVGTVMAFGGGDTGLVSRLIGLTAIGAASGAAIGLIEELRKQAWIIITGGPLTGKQFILYNRVTSVGSSPKCDIALLKDPYIAPQHCLIEITGNAYMVRDLATQTGTAVNGRPIQRQALRNGDVIQIGQTALTYHDRALSPVQPGVQSGYS